ncbi:YbaK/EbsC family protein [Candidatus Shapirobacteria bacterium]|nr:YbaK/EbsC family protein [Candidatus Shapirobacteria bacterium]
MKSIFPNEIVFKELTRTAQEAATQIGCKVAQIAKSLIFKDETGQPVLVIASGVNRVDEKKLGLQKADADFVKEKTWMVIGGVAPWGHKEKFKTYIDIDLGKYDKIWASSGKNNAVFETSMDELIQMTEGEVRKIN